MTAHSLLNPSDSLEQQHHKLLKIVDVLMRRVEFSTNHTSYLDFQNAALLEAQVRARTTELEQALVQLNMSNDQLGRMRLQAEQAQENLTNALEAVREGFALFDAEDRLISSNSRFATLFYDVASEVKPGLFFKDYIQLVSDSEALLLEEGMSREAWRRSRMRDHSSGHANFLVSLQNDRWLQVSEQHTASGHTAILQTEVTDLLRVERKEWERIADDYGRRLLAALDHVSDAIFVFDSRQTLIAFNRLARELPCLNAGQLQQGLAFISLLLQLQSWAKSKKNQKFLNLLRDLKDWVEQEDAELDQDFTGESELDLGQIFKLECAQMGDGCLILTFRNIKSLNAHSQSGQSSCGHPLHERPIGKRSLREAHRDVSSSILAAPFQAVDQRQAFDQAYERSRFFASACHDLLQPLHAARLFLNSLQNIGLEPQQDKVSKQIESALGSMQEIISVLLEISRLNMGAITPRLNDFNLCEIFDPLIAECKILSGEFGPDIVSVGTQLRVRSDAVYLRRIVQNLIANAIHHASAQKILVGAHRRGQVVEIVIMDNGQGIPEDQQENVFVEFQRFLPAIDARKTVDKMQAEHKAAGDCTYIHAQNHTNADAEIRTRGRTKKYERGLQKPNQLGAEGPNHGLGLAFVRSACAMLGHDLKLSSREAFGCKFVIRVPLKSA